MSLLLLILGKIPASHFKKNVNGAGGMWEGARGVWEGCEKDVVGVRKGSRRGMGGVGGFCGRGVGGLQEVCGRCTGGVWKVWFKADKDFSLKNVSGRIFLPERFFGYTEYALKSEIATTQYVLNWRI